MRRRPLLAAASLVLAALVLLVAPAAAGATARPSADVTILTAAHPGQEPDAPADDGTGGSAEDDDPAREEDPVPGDIIPEPDSGRAPEDAGDRGGGLQALVLVLIVAGVGGVTAMIVRESRRNRSRERAARPLP